MTRPYTLYVRTCQATKMPNWMRDWGRTALGYVDPEGPLGNGWYRYERNLDLPALRATGAALTYVYHLRIEDANGTVLPC